MDKTESRAEHTKLRIALTIVFACASMIAFYYILRWNQNMSTMDQIQKEMKENARYLKESIEDAKSPFQKMNGSMEDVYFGTLGILARMSEKDPEFEISDEYLARINSYLNMSDIMIADRKGRILASSTGESPAVDAKVFDPLREVFGMDEMAVMDVGEMLTGAAQIEDPKDKEALRRFDNFDRLYAKAYDEDHEIIIRVPNLLSSFDMADINAWSSILENETIGQNGYVFVWSDETKQLLYYPKETEAAGDVSELGMDMEQIRDDSFGWQNIYATRMYTYTAYDSREKAWIACVVPASEIVGARKFNRVILSIGFAMMAFVLAYYVVLLLLQKKVRVLPDFTGSDKPTVHRSRKYKLMVLSVLLLAVVFLMHFYIHTLYQMSTWAESSTRQTELIKQGVSDQENAAKMFIDLYRNERRMQFELLASYLSKNQEEYNSYSLDEISFLIEAYDIQLLDVEGNTVVGTSSMAYPAFIPRQPDVDGDESAAADTGVDGQEAESAKPSEWMANGRSRTIQMLDDDGNLSGYLYIKYYSINVDDALRSYSLKETLKRTQPDRDGFIFAVDTQTGKFICFPQEEMEGKDPIEYGMTENQMKENFCDYLTVNGVTYYAATNMIGTDLIYYAVTKSNLLSNRFRISFISLLAAGALFLLIGLPLYTSREQVEVIRPEKERHSFSDDRKSPEYRTMRLIMYFTVGSAALMAAYTSFRSGSSGGIFGYVLDQKWEHGFNVFAITASILILCQGGLVLFCVSRLIQMVGDILPVRSGTILKMLGSLMTYVAVAFLVYQCMICFGLNPTALMASAGIVSVVVGIGANSLVGDILAGMFLLMEGDVQVGDVVQVGNFRGYVMELGIRMTKLFDMDLDDVKIIPNNEVRNVVHMTMRPAIVYSEFQIQYEEKLESVEKILQEELRNVKDKSPLILSGPVYIGVHMLDESGVVLRTVTRCHESSRRKVEREVNHIVYSIFQKNDISVPFPQVTIHQGEEGPIER